MPLRKRRLRDSNHLLIYDLSHIAADLRSLEREISVWRDDPLWECFATREELLPLFDTPLPQARHITKNFIEFLRLLDVHFADDGRCSQDTVQGIMGREINAKDYIVLAHKEANEFKRRAQQATATCRKKLDALPWARPQLARLAGHKGQSTTDEFLDALMEFPYLRAC